MEDGCLHEPSAQYSFSFITRIAFLKVNDEWRGLEREVAVLNPRFNRRLIESLKENDTDR